MPAASHDPFSDDFLRRLERLHLVARRLFSGRERGERRARKPGSGIEFADHRDYSHGDDPRYLDWGAYARLGRLLVRLFEEEQELRIFLLLDTSASMGRGDGRKFDRARQVVAALGYIGLANLDHLAIAALAKSGGLGALLPPVRGLGSVTRMLGFLRGLAPSGSTDLRAGCEAFARRMTGLRGSGRGVCVLVSDFYDLRYGDALDLLRHHHFEVQAIQIVDADDARPDLAGDVELVDCEGGAARELNVTPRLLAACAREHDAFCDGIERFCVARAIPSVRADTQVPFDELVLRVLRERGAVG